MSYDLKATSYEEKWEQYLEVTHNRLLSWYEGSKGDRVLDISAGTGLLAHQLIREGAEFESLVLNDVSGKMLDIAKQRLSSEQKVSFTQSSAQELVHPSGEFDTVICLNAFHHYKEQNKVIDEIGRVLKPGGSVYFLDWNRTGWFRIVNWIIKKWVRDPIHTRSLQETSALLQNQGFKVDKSEEWQYRYWKLFTIKAEKVS
ncbi:class I SAM-dependent methyltransferase [Gracilimonas mengyeensis]|uniref:Methyltransferase domain-containing protein n=1 Tax=Gracilimonas mengyeensis TaxID=1302730 RepID=A0A521DKA5_9BACT|nr:class I SAM-dependent methyltransferase [Gracilimonas mengyeensis]SMO71360.1 Methyltransferase domain-containing protein [Gracilimonas mengyeensis]